MKLISKYEAILNKKSESASKINIMKPVKSMMELLELIMIQQISELS